MNRFEWKDNAKQFFQRRPRAVSHRLSKSFFLYLSQKKKKNRKKGLAQLKRRRLEGFQTTHFHVLYVEEASWDFRWSLSETVLASPVAGEECESELRAKGP